MSFVRVWLPALVVAFGVAVIVIRADTTGLAGGAGIIGAGLSIWLLNFLFRVGVSGDRDRDREDEARRYFDRHGRWPDES
jgi:hypothetical protein